jgi:hypothetical protein
MPVGNDKTQDSSQAAAMERIQVVVTAAQQDKADLARDKMEASLVTSGGRLQYLVHVLESFDALHGEMMEWWTCWMNKRV